MRIGNERSIRTLTAIEPDKWLVSMASACFILQSVAFSEAGREEHFLREGNLSSQQFHCPAVMLSFEYDLTAPVLDVLTDSLFKNYYLGSPKPVCIRAEYTFSCPDRCTICVYAYILSVQRRAYLARSVPEILASRLLGHTDLFLCTKRKMNQTTEGQHISQFSSSPSKGSLLFLHRTLVPL